MLPGFYVGLVLHVRQVRCEHKFSCGAAQLLCDLSLWCVIKCHESSLCVHFSSKFREGLSPGRAL